jgi:hypothetical protein
LLHGQEFVALPNNANCIGLEEQNHEKYDKDDDVESLWFQLHQFIADGQRAAGRKHLMYRLQVA